MTTATINAPTNFSQYYDRSYVDKKVFRQNDERKLSNRAKKIVIDTVIAPFIDSETWINDLSAGKFQDFQKYIDVLSKHWMPSDNRIRYVGSDISQEGITEGLRRVKQKGLSPWFKGFQCDLMGSVIPDNHPLKHMLEANKHRNNIVSVQLAISLAFKSEEFFQNMMHNMVITGPKLIFLTYPDPEKITSGQQFKTATISNLQLTERFFGSSYTYEQQGTTVNKPFTEYLVDEVLLSVVLAEQGYDVIFDKSHQELVGTTDDSAVSLYKSVVFQKRQ